MVYYAHTAEDEEGNRLPEDRWQPLATHLKNVAALARKFAEPLGLADEAELAGFCMIWENISKVFRNI